MATVTLNGVPVLSLSLSMPLSGAWSANIELATGAAPDTGAAAFLSLPGQGLEGLVKRSGVFAERAQLRVIGGTVDWETQLPSQNYQNTTVATVLEDKLGMNWRVNPDGTVRLRAEAPETVSNAAALELERDETRGLVTVAVERATVLPGTVVNGDTVGDVLYEAGTDFRCRYRTNGKPGLRGMLEALVRRITRDTLYLGTFLCEVSKQSADGTLDLMPFDQRLRATGLQSVPLRHGWAGVKEMTVPPGELVMLAYDEGKPNKPYAALFNSGKVTKVVLDIGSLEVGGTVAVALATLVKSELTRFAAVFDAHVHAVPALGTSAPTLTLITPVAEVSAQKLKTS
jgi:hypothetical protein